MLLSETCHTIAHKIAAYPGNLGLNARLKFAVKINLYVSAISEKQTPVLKARTRQLHVRK